MHIGQHLGAPLVVDRARRGGACRPGSNCDRVLAEHVMRAVSRRAVLAGHVPSCACSHCSFSGHGWGAQPAPYRDPTSSSIVIDTPSRADHLPFLGYGRNTAPFPVQAGSAGHRVPREPTRRAPGPLQRPRRFLTSAYRYSTRSWLGGAGGPGMKPTLRDGTSRLQSNSIGPEDATGDPEECRVPYVYAVSDNPMITEQGFRERLRAIRTLRRSGREAGQRRGQILAAA
jgi:hypothetical protein